MSVRVIGSSVWMDFDRVCKNDQVAERFIRAMLNINKSLTLVENPLPDTKKGIPPSDKGHDKRLEHRPRKRRWYSFRTRMRRQKEHTQSRISLYDSWRERNKKYKLSIIIERVKDTGAHG